MDMCLLCLELQHESVDCINVTSRQWEEDNIEQLIEQHFWPLESITSDAWICGACWHVLNEFHQFYIRVEDAHVGMAITMNTVQSPQQQPVVASDTADFEDMIDKELSKQIQGINIVINLNNLPSEPELRLDQLAQSSVHEDCSNLEEALSMEQAVTSYFHENVVQGHLNEFETEPHIDLIQTDKLDLVDEMPTYLIQEGTLALVGGNDDTELPTYQILASQTVGVEVGNDNIDLSSRQDIDEDNLIQLDQIQISGALSDQIEVVNEPPIDHVKRSLSDQEEKQSGNRKDNLDQVQRGGDHNGLAESHVEIQTNQVVEDHNEVVIEESGRDKTLQSTEPNSEDLEEPIDYPSASGTPDSYSDNESLALGNNKSKNHDEFLSKHFKIDCPICQEAMPTFKNLLKHFVDVHKRRGYAKCCDRKFMGRGSLVEHIRWHCEPHNYKCKYCDKVMTTKRSLSLHEKHIHEKDYIRHKCDICQKMFASANVLNSHKLTHLSDDKDIKTSLSDPEEKQLDNLDQVQSGGVHESPAESPIQIQRMQFVEEDNEVIKDVCNDEEPMTDEEVDNRICRRDPLKKPLITKNNTIPKALLDEGNVSMVLLECIEDLCEKKSDDILEETCSQAPKESLENETKIKLCKIIIDKTLQPIEHNLEDTSDYPSDCKTPDSYSDNESSALGNNKSKKIDEYLSKHFKIYCPICQEAMLTFKNLLQHFVDVHKTLGYANCCDRKFMSRGSLVEHIRWHCEPHNYKCKYCGKVMSTKRSLSLHEKHIHEKNYIRHKCDICQKMFASANVLKNHKLTHLSDDEKKFHCDQCAKKFGSNSLLFNHIRSVHMAKYIKICDICGKKLRCREDFEHHVLTHKCEQLPQVACDICGLKLCSSKAVKHHKSILHPVGGKKEYKCHICSKVSDNLMAHRGHIRYKHEMTRNYKCKICGKGFKKEFSLKEHMACHTKNPSFSCPYCPKTFNSNANMHSHRKRDHPQEWLDDRRQKYSGQLPPKLIPPSTLHKHIGYPLPEDAVQ